MYNRMQLNMWGEKLKIKWGWRLENYPSKSYWGDTLTRK